MAVYTYSQFRKVLRAVGFVRVRTTKHETWDWGMQLTLVRFVCALDGRPEGAERE